MFIYFANFRNQVRNRCIFMFNNVIRKKSFTDFNYFCFVRKCAITIRSYIRTIVRFVYA